MWEKLVIGRRHMATGSLKKQTHCRKKSFQNCKPTHCKPLAILQKKFQWKYFSLARKFFCKYLNQTKYFNLPWNMTVVYFNQRRSALYTILWLKSSFSAFKQVFQPFSITNGKKVLVLYTNFYLMVNTLLGDQLSTQ